MIWKAWEPPSQGKVRQLLSLMREGGARANAGPQGLFN